MLKFAKKIVFVLFRTLSCSRSRVKMERLNNTAAAFILMYCIGGIIRPSQLWIWDSFDELSFGATPPQKKNKQLPLLYKNAFSDCIWMAASMQASYPFMKIV